MVCGTGLYGFGMLSTYLMMAHWMLWREAQAAAQAGRPAVVHWCTTRGALVAATALTIGASLVLSGLSAGNYVPYYAMFAVLPFIFTVSAHRARCVVSGYIQRDIEHREIPTSLTAWRR